MNKDKFLIISLIIVLFFIFMSTWGHEFVHVLNNNSVGVESRIVFALYDGWIPTVGIQRIGFPKREISNFEMIHLQNEIIGYNLIPMLIGICIILIFGFVYLVEILKNNKW